jgi:hypothetical protein
LSAGVREPLREVPRVRQHAGDDGQRRWFASPTTDLFVWERAGLVTRFEICYGKPHREHVLSWDAAAGFRHDAIDDGEARPTHNRTPIAVPDGRFDLTTIALGFEEDGARIEPRLYRFVLGRLLAGA